MNTTHPFGKWLSLIFVGTGLLVSGCARAPQGVEDHPPSNTSGDHSGSQDSTNQSKSEAEHHHAPSSEQPLAATLHLQTSPAGPMAGDEIEIRGMLHDSSGQMLKDFEVVHEKKIHLIIVRDGLDEFAHLHPAIEPDGSLSVSHTFAKGGKHHVFVDYKPVGKSQATAKDILTVGGDSPNAEQLRPNVPGRVDSDEMLADVSMEVEGTSPVVRFRLLDSSSQPIADLQPYLGAMGHLVVIGAEADQYVHAHPLESKTNGNVVEFEVHFPKAGVYKLWGQFQRNGEVHTIPAVVQFGGEVQKH